MVTGPEVAVGRGVVDAIPGAFKKAKTRKLRANAEAKLAEAIRELLLAKPDLNKVDAAIATAKAASIISNDLFLAENMRSSVRGYSLPRRRTAKKAAKKATRKPARKSAAKRTSKKPSAKRLVKR